MRYFRGILAVALTATVIGCGGGSSEKSVDVSGVVTLDDKPLSGVEVHFATDGFEGYGKTDAEGRYRLVNGAAVGPNKIYFMKYDTATGGTEIDTSIPGMDEGQVAAMMEAQGGGKPGETKAGLIPADYSSAATTKLTYPVPEGGTDSADFRLSSN